MGKKFKMRNIEYHENFLTRNMPPKAYKKWFDVERKIIMETLTKNSKILDIGCGEGRTIRYALDLTKPCFAGSR